MSDTARRQVADTANGGGSPVSCSCGAAILLGPAAGQAQAHAALISSSPGEGATLDKAPSRVVLVFDEDVLEKFADIVVTAPDGAGISTGDAAVTAKRVVTTGRPTAAGDYTVAWRVVSDDGHPVDGQFTYTLTKHALTTGQVAATTMTGSTTTGSSDSWASQHLLSWPSGQWLWQLGCCCF
jgi:copper resistance protein C